MGWGGGVYDVGGVAVNLLTSIHRQTHIPRSVIGTQCC